MVASTRRDLTRRARCERGFSLLLESRLHKDWIGQPVGIAQNVFIDEVCSRVR